MIIVYFILMANGWQFEAIENHTSSAYYCEWLKNNLAERSSNKIGDMKIVCIEDRSQELQFNIPLLNGQRQDHKRGAKEVTCYTVWYVKVMVTVKVAV